MTRNIPPHTDDPGHTTDAALSDVDQGPVVAGAPSDNTTMLEILNEFRRRGHHTDMRVVTGGEFHCESCGRSFPPEQTELLRLRRIEGASDPADLAVVAGIRCAGCGAAGVVVMQFGPQADIAHETALRRVEDRRT